MRVLVGLFVYNEIDYIKSFIKYYKSQDCEFCFIDNYSDDGTYEYLLEQGFDVKRVDTDDCFDLVKLQKELLKSIHEIKPDWIIIAAADTFIIFDGTIKEEIFKASQRGYNQISTIYLKPYNTGEKFRLPLESNYFYIEERGRKLFISKYDENINFKVDDFSIKNSKLFKSNGVLINYGDCKPAEYRKNIYKRRKKAWENGLDKKFGEHYKSGNEKNWKWDKNKLIDIRKTKYYFFVEKLHDITL